MILKLLIGSGPLTERQVQAYLYQVNLIITKRVFLGEEK